MEHFYGDEVLVHVFAHDAMSSWEPPVEFVRKAKLVPSTRRSGELLDECTPGEVYHVPVTNSIYFSENFTDYEIVGTVESPHGLELYCDFYAAFEPAEVARMLIGEGWEKI